MRKFDEGCQSIQKRQKINQGKNTIEKRARQKAEAMEKKKAIQEMRKKTVAFIFFIYYVIHVFLQNLSFKVEGNPPPKASLRNDILLSSIF